MFDKEEIGTVLFCGYLIKVIDNEIHASEKKACDQFAKQHWKKEFGELNNDYFFNILLKVKKFFRDPKDMNDKLDELIVKINKNFDSPKKKDLLALMWKVMEADGHIRRHEKQLFEQFEQGLT